MIKLIKCRKAFSFFLFLVFYLSTNGLIAPRSHANPIFIPLILRNPSSCTFIFNGDFEQGINGANGWIQSSLNNIPLIVDANYLDSNYGAAPHNGIWAASLCGVSNEVAGLKQPISVSASCPSLSYWHWIDSFAPCGVHFGKVIITDLTGTKTVDTYDLCSAAITNGWVIHTVDLNTYAGKTVTLEIRAECNTADVSILLLDDISFQ